MPTAPFDPERVTPNPQGQIPEMSVWAHDDTVVPGRTYRYRVRVRTRTRCTTRSTFAKDPKLAEQFTIDTPFTEWKEVKAPRNTEILLRQHPLRTSSRTR